VSDELQFAHHPFEDEGLPESWEITALDDVLENIRPGFASGQHNKDGEGIPHLRPMNISPSVRYHGRIGFTSHERELLEPQQLTLTEALTAKGKLMVPEQCMTEASYGASIDSQLPSQ